MAMPKRPIIPDIFENWIEKQRDATVKAKPGFIAEEKI
jgi:hypothetical protein